MRYNFYGPTRLDQIIGQESACNVLQHILKNKILQQETGEKTYIPQALLFSGQYGVGKTSMARIFARGMNCSSTVNLPCNECDSCLFQQNIIETDSAIFTQVDNIRQRLEDLMYLPTTTPYKIYIFDEAHMLSRSAFDALLSTLQDPPSYAIFIFTTTRVDKLPDTFFSRCLHFSLKNISKEVIASQIDRILQLENETLNQDVKDLIVRGAEGSMRQALSMLDYILLLDNKSYDAVQKALRILNKDDVLKILIEIFEGRTNVALNLWKEYKELGCDNRTFFTNLSDILKGLLCSIIGVEKEYTHLLEKYTISANLLAGWWEILLMQYEANKNDLPNTVESTILLFSLLEEDVNLSEIAKRAFGINS